MQQQIQIHRLQFQLWIAFWYMHQLVFGLGSARLQCQLFQLQDHDAGWHQHSEWSGHAFLEVWECHVGSTHRLQSKQFWSNHILDPSGMRSQAPQF